MSKSQITRFDKNLAHNVKDFAVFGDSSSLIINIAIFLAFEHQEKLQTSVRFDLSRFCEVMGYDKASLLRKVENPLHKEIHQEGEYLLEREIENALYMMSTRNIIFTNRGMTKEDGEYQELKSMNLITSVKVYVDKQAKGRYGKFYYDIEMSDLFKKHLSVFYFHINIGSEIFKQLRKNNLLNFYLYLKNQENYLKLNGSEYTRDYTLDALCDLADIHISYAPDKKRKLVTKINLLNKLCKSNWALTFVKNGKYNFKPQISFLNLLNPETKEEKNKEKQEIFTKELQRQLKEIYDKVYLTSQLKNATPLDFNEWILNNDLNKEQKMQVFEEVQTLIWGKTVYKLLNQVDWNTGFDIKEDI